MMDDLNTRDIVRLLKRLESATGIFSVARVYRFECYRRTKAGGEERVLVELLDRGPDDPESRYMCVATSETGKSASGNSGATPDEAIAVAHWYDLDK